MANDSQAQVSTNTQMAPANMQVAPATAPATTQMAPATAPATTRMAPATANGMTPPVKKSKKWLWWTIGIVALFMQQLLLKFFIFILDSRIIF